MANPKIRRDDSPKGTDKAIEKKMADRIISDNELTRDEKITTILEIILVSQEHHTSVRELFADLSDVTVNNIYNHSLVMKPHFEKD